MARLAFISSMYQRDDGQTLAGSGSGCARERSGFPMSINYFASMPELSKSHGEDAGAGDRGTEGGAGLLDQAPSRIAPACLCFDSLAEASASDENGPMPTPTGSIYPFDAAPRAPLVVDAVYAGSDERQHDALPALLGVGVQGGFRVLGRNPNYRLVALTTSGEEPDWPDEVDRARGRLLYFGDNRHPGSEIHSKVGNRLLRYTFDSIYASPPRRDAVPPFFVFGRRRGLLDPASGSNRDLVFLGLAAPGAPNLGEMDDLVAAWRTKAGRRFQNYRAIFTILDASPIQRDWLDLLMRGEATLDQAPPAWRAWVEDGRHLSMTAPEHPRFRTEAEQWPSTAAGVAVIREIRRYFMPDPSRLSDATRFERCAAELWRMACREPVTYEVTRPVVDRGRDAIGELRLGPDADPIPLDFSLEAKLFDYEAGIKVTTSHTKRLISRIRHRQFGIIVTTSVVARQAYDEIREDRHPIVILSARDITEVLARHGYGDAASVGRWLRAEFPTDT